MCGIMCYIGHSDAVPVIVNGLNRMEYRGYDSAGIAVYRAGTPASIEVVKKAGRLPELTKALKDFPGSTLGFGHTRWATHGVPSDRNAHPHTDCYGNIVVIHNGIIENYAPLRQQLMLEGHDFVSETDTEVIAHLIEKYYRTSLEAAVRQTLAMVHGSFALAIMHRNEPDKIIVAQKHSPLIVGLGEGENFVASDISAISGYTDQAYILDGAEFAVVKADEVIITDFIGDPVDKPIVPVTSYQLVAEKNGYEHYMLKEIHEQPEAIRATFKGTTCNGQADFSQLGLDDVFRQLGRIFIVACGTAYHAGLVGRVAIEKLAKVPVETDIASEFCYREVLWNPNDLMIVISQSGETADTRAALREAKRQGIKVLAITNVVGSAIAREADEVIYTNAGPEIAVASTKAYITQLVVIYLLALYLADVRGAMGQEDLRGLYSDLLYTDVLVEQVLSEEGRIKQIATRYADVESTFFLGRGFDYAVAMEGALKLKEISYIHAEAYAAGELKHGPLALIHQGVPVLALITQDGLVEKTMSNIKEVKARGAVVVAICKSNLQESCQECDDQILLPDVNPILAPIVGVVPLQIFAYYMAVVRGLDVDKPRNLAKSVTVE